MPLTTLVLLLVVGGATGFLGGLFGKGGSALATPVLAAFGVPPIVAVASPLPATIPGTLVAARQYWRERHVDTRVLAWTTGIGLPFTILGALLTRLVDPDHLVAATDLVVAGLGVSILAGHRSRRGRPPTTPAVASTTPGAASASGVAAERHPGPVVPGRTTAGRTTAEGATTVLAPPATVVEADRTSAPRLFGVAAVVGLLAGLLANSGGFLLAPLYLVVLALPLRRALGTSLAASALLAVPGTVTHAALGHIDWGFVAAFGAASVPLSALGARVALRVDPERLEVCFGALLVVAATLLLVWG